MKEDLVSVIVPCFNEESNVTGCLESIVSQDYSPLEVLVIDDTSTDNTVEALARFKLAHPEFYFYQLEHGGPGKARNYAAKIAWGRVLVFCDADNEYPKDYVRKLVEPILKGECVGTSHKYLIPKSGQNLFARMKAAEHLGLGKRMEVKETKVYRAIRKDVFLKAGGFDTSSDYYDDSSVYRRVNEILERERK